jgi:hypothetical protein
MSSKSKFLAVFAAMMLTGCVSVMEDPKVFNTELAAPRGGARSLSCLSDEAMATCILPGMKLIMQESDAGDRRTQSRTLIGTRSEWVVPSVKQFGQEDLFQLARLLAIATPDNAGVAKFDASRCYEYWLEHNYGAFRERFVETFLGTLALRYNKRPADETHGAASVQSWMRDLPSAAMVSEQIYGSARLTFAIPRLTAPGGDACAGGESGPQVRLRAFGGGSPLQRQIADDATTKIEAIYATGWYAENRDLVRSRSFITVQVPVTVEGSVGLHYVPIHASLGEIPALLGIAPERFRGVRRDNRLIPATLLQGQPMQPRTRLAPNTSSHALYSGTSIPISDRMLAQLLIAPGDEILVSP